jgi:glycosyltransferase involved in cell wall biosynthesis
MNRLLFFTSLPEIGGHTTITVALVRLLRNLFDEVIVIAKEMPGHGTSSEAVGALHAVGATTHVFAGRIPPVTLWRVGAGRRTALLAMGMRHLSPLLCCVWRPSRSIYYHITHDLTPKVSLGLEWYSRVFDEIAFISPATERMWKSSLPRPTATRSLLQPSARITPSGEMVDRSGPIRFGFVGRLTEGKGCRVLIDFAQSGTVPCELVVAGGGGFASEFRALHSGSGRPVKVRFDGPFSPADQAGYLANLFAEVDYLVVPSQDELEGLPTVILEALGGGVPVIATRTGGMRAFDDPNFQWGVPGCVELVDPNRVGAALSERAALPRPSPQLKRACIEYYDSRFSQHALFDAWREALLGLPVAGNL